MTTTPHEPDPDTVQPDVVPSGDTAPIETPPMPGEDPGVAPEPAPEP